MTLDTEIDKVAAEIVRGFRLRYLFHRVYIYAKRGTLHHLKRIMLRWKATSTELGKVRRDQRARQQAELDAAANALWGGV